THRRVRLIHTSALLLSIMAALLQVCNAQDVTPEDSSEPPIEGAAPVELLPISPEKNSVHDKGFDLEGWRKLVPDLAAEQKKTWLFPFTVRGKQLKHTA